MGEWSKVLERISQVHFEGTPKNMQGEISGKTSWEFHNES